MVNLRLSPKGTRRAGEETPTEIDNAVLRGEVEYLRSQLAREIAINKDMYRDLTDSQIRVGELQRLVTRLERSVFEERRETDHYRRQLGSEVKPTPVPMAEATADAPTAPLKVVALDQPAPVELEETVAPDVDDSDVTARSSESYFGNEQTFEVPLPPKPTDQPRPYIPGAANDPSMIATTAMPVVKIVPLASKGSENDSAVNVDR